MSRPSDYIDTGFEDRPLNEPKLGPVGWLRWAWRQLTSMRTALLLLLLLALAAVPGSLIPQTAADPNGVTQWKQDNPSLVGIANAIQLFDVYTSFWFSAIYLLLFLSLVGCVIPRIGHHMKAVKADPPKTPARLDRLPAFQERLARADVEQAVVSAERILKRRRYRTKRYGDSISAERGYLRETGNLVFHLALVGILISVFVGGGFTFTGEKIVVTGQSFVNTQGGYDSITPGRFYSSSQLTPYSLRLKNLAVTYDRTNLASLGEPLDYTATVLQTTADGKQSTKTIKVNHPLSVGGTLVYLLANGYAPHITVRNAAGQITLSDYTPFLPQDSEMTSLGVVKVNDASADDGDQLGMVGFFYPTGYRLASGAYASSYPDLENPLLSLQVWQGDLGTNSGVPSNVYQLDTGKLHEVDSGIVLRPGQTKQIAGGRGTITFDGVARYAEFDIHHDPSQNWVFAFAMLVLAGLIVSLLVPRRRMWMTAAAAPDGIRMQYAALARGDDPTLERAVAEFAEEHAASLGGAQPESLAAEERTNA